MKRKPLVILGLLGPTLDNGRGTERWERWRPTVALCQHEDLLIDRFELLYQPRYTALAKVVASDIPRISPETEVCPRELNFDDAWDFATVYGALHDFARVYPFKPDHEDYLVHITTGSHVAQICLFLLTESRFLPARLVQTAPPSRDRGMTGSFSVIDLDLSKYDALASRFAQQQVEGKSFLKSGIPTRNKKFNAMIDQIEQVATGSRAPLLLTGPTGAGKSQLAKRIFELKKSRRQVEGNLVEVNCATLRGDGAMSALFGHVKGAFTGASSDRPGLLRSADGGVLFLDEIGELGSDEQAMLLRAIEDKRFLPHGSDREVKSDFQLIAGTNASLQSRVRDGSFREDLLARINLWTFALPPLRDRREDIEPNLEYELERFAQQSGDRVTFNKEARERFVKFAKSPAATWPGNFRDLNAAVTRMATLASGGRITTAIVDGEIARLETAWTSPRDDGQGLEWPEIMEDDKLDAIDRFDQVQLADVIRVCRQSRSLSDAGRKLFAVSRLEKRSPNDADRLKKYLARFGLSFERVVDAG
jgi:transcriptional regulatory protein RtcR